jgi:hypothetical protein
LKHVPSRVLASFDDDDDDVRGDEIKKMMNESRGMKNWRRK